MGPRLLYLIFLLAILAPISHLFAHPQIMGGASYTDTSDDHEMRVVHLGYHHPRWSHSWPYSEQSSSTWFFGLDLFGLEGETETAEFKGQKIQLPVGWQKDIIFVTLAPGFHKLKRNGVSEEKEIVDFTSTLGFTFSEHFSLLMNYEYDFVYQSLVMPAGANNFYTSNTYELVAQFFISKKLKSKLSNSFAGLSDGNIRRQNLLNLMYGVSPSWPWVWVGIGGEFLSYSNDSTVYWSPRKYFSIGPQFESAFPIFGEMRGLFSLNFNAHKESNQDNWGRGHYGSVGVAYGERDEANLTLTYEDILSRQNNSKWTSRSYILEIFVPI